jgi:hypothetical protein
MVAPSDDSAAVCFFLMSIVGLGRGFKSTQGFLEPLLPVIARERPGSVLSTVLTAVSTKIWGHWKDPTSSFEAPHAPFSTALARLGEALNDPVEVSRDSTVFGVILMHFYESVAARSTHRPTRRAHQDGARALLDRRAETRIESESCTYLRTYLRHCDVSYYLETQPTDISDLDVWIHAGWDSSTVVSPNLVLDLIGLSLAHLQTRLSEMLSDFARSDFHDTDTDTDTVVDTWTQDIESIETQLADWVQMVPNDWKPYQRQIDKSVFYLSTCDIYPTVQIATIWNVWRVCRLMVLRMRLCLLAKIPKHTMHRTTLRGLQQSAFANSISGRELVDSICQSMPFYLGNRRAHGGMHDLVDPGVQIISYHDCAVDEDVRERYLQGDDAMSLDEYRRHVLVQGPSHALLHLNALIKVLSSEGGQDICRAIGASRAAWLRDQFLRVCKLTNPTPLTRINV